MADSASGAADVACYHLHTFYFGNPREKTEIFFKLEVVTIQIKINIPYEICIWIGRNLHCYFLDKHINQLLICVFYEIRCTTKCFIDLFLVGKLILGDNQPAECKCIQMLKRTLDTYQATNFCVCRSVFLYLGHTVRPSGCVTYDTGTARVGPLHMTATFTPRSLKITSEKSQG